MPHLIALKVTKKATFFLFLAIAFWVRANAQFPQKEWQNRYSDIVPNVPPLNTDDGGFLILSVNADVVVTKTDANGIIQWKKNYGGRHSDGSGYVSFLKGNDGGYMIISSSNSNDRDLPASNDTSFSNIWLLKINEQGAVEFSKIIQSDSTSEMNLSAIATNNEDGYLAIVQIYDSHPSHHADGLLTNCTATTLSYKFIKIDNYGNLIYQKCLDKDFGFAYQFFKLSNGVGSKYLLLDNGLINSNGMCNILRLPSIAMIDDTLHFYWKKFTNQYNLPTRFYSTGNPEGPSVLFKNNTLIFPLYDMSRCTYHNPLVIIGIDTLGNLLWKNITENRMGQLVSPVDADSSSFYITRRNNALVNDQTDTSFILKYSSGDGSLMAKKSLSFLRVDPFTHYFNDFEEIQLLRKEEDIYFWGSAKGAYPDPQVYQITYNKLLLGKLGPVNTLVGYCFVDTNHNHIKDSSEAVVTGLKILGEKSEDNFSYSFTDSSGRFEIFTDTGAYHFSVDEKILSSFSIFPDPVLTNHSTYNFTDTIHFALTPVPGKNDVSLNLISTGVARPGFPSTYEMIFKNNAGANPANGVIKLIKDPRMAFNNSSKPPASINGDTLFWNYGQLPVLGLDNITLSLQLSPPPALNVNDTISLLAFISSSVAQSDSSNDTAALKQLVRGAFDPNDKQEINAGRFSSKQIEKQKELQYTIRFQNTGNYPASTVIIKDTLDENLDWKTLRLVAASHPYRFAETREHQLKWIFDNINLPDSFANEKASHGFITYVVKPKASLQPGQVINNKASIYFDYNLPVVTNNQQTVIYKSVDPVIPGLPVEIKDIALTLFPNPASKNSVVRVSSKFAHSNLLLSIFNSSGKRIISMPVNVVAGDNLIPVTLPFSGSGVYIVSVSLKGKTYSARLLKIK